MADKPTMRCIVIKSTNSDKTAIERTASHALGDDPFESTYGTYNAIEPPYNLQVLSSLDEFCGELRPSIDAMVTNIERLGHRIIPRPNVQSENEPLSKEIKAEIAVARNFFENAVLDADIGTFKELRSRLRVDYEKTGNNYVEVIPMLDNPMMPAGLNHLPSWTMRLRKQDDYFTSYEVPRPTEIDDGKWIIKMYPTAKRFRQFVQIREYGVNGVFFKEWGDPRIADKRDGSIADENLQVEFRAHEVIHNKLYSAKSPYGLPRTIGTLFDIFGIRAASEINYVTFENNQIPALALLATNVAVTQGSLDRLKEFIEERVQGNKNYATIIVVEGEPIGDSMKDPGSMKMDLKPLSDVQHTDAMFQAYMDKCEARVRRAFRIPRIFTGSTEELNRACYSADTETLTEKGWKKHTEIAPDEKIAAYDPSNGQIIFVMPDKKYVYQVENEKMFHYDGRTTDCLVTHDHTMLVRSLVCHGDKSVPNEWTVFKADMMPYARFEVAMAATIWEGTEIDKFYLSKADECRAPRGQCHFLSVRGDDWLEFLGYFISEGAVLTAEHPNTPLHISLSQKDDDKVAKIANCLDRIGWGYSSYVSKDDGVTCFQMSNRCLRKWLVENVGTYSYNKKIPWEYLNLSRRQLQVLFDAMMLGDGTVENNGICFSYSTSSLILAGQVQRLLIQLGCRAVVGPGPGTRSMKVSFTHHKGAELKVEDSGRCKANVKRVDYSGEVYCYSVPGYGFFVTRRNGKVAIHGNTSEAARKLAEEQIFAPERSAIDDLFTNTIIARLGLAAVVYKSNTPSVTDNYELTQLLATAERSGGLTPRIGRRIIEIVLGTELPDVSSDINPDLPYTWTMLKAELESQDPAGSDTITTTKARKILKNLDKIESVLETIVKSGSIGS